MPDATAARPIGFGALLAEQLRWFWRRLRVWILVVTVLVAGAVSWIIAVIPERELRMGNLVFGSALHPLLLLIALSWAFSAWRDDPPKDRQYFWLHPVSRTKHTVARTLSGALWLLAVLALIVIAVLGTSFLVHGSDGPFGTPRFWLYVGTAICIAYLMASIAPVLSDRPGMWLFGLIAIVILAEIVAAIREIEWLQRVVQVFRGGAYSLGAALTAPTAEAMRLFRGEPAAGSMADPTMAEAAATAEPGAALLIWLPIAVVLYLVAARESRPR
ncbi:MAG TPA: hypothetical protein VMN78_13295 [Longimicrobiales bacterium]|nr:hypothetical protein [Longimicrobiales bacterium]